MGNPLNVGLLVIATNKYIDFVSPLWESAKKFFLAGTPHKIHLFVFTNMPNVPEGAVRIQHEHKPWPYPTLMRYKAFADNDKSLEGMDYVYYSDADMRFEGNVGEEVLGDLVVTKHPGFWDKPPEFFRQSYEKNPESLAFIPPGVGDAYYAGGFNGGKREVFMAMAKELSRRIDEDLKKNIIAAWHDESHMNKYVTEHPPNVKLSPAYCYQEELDMPFERKLVALWKDHSKWRT
jgi:histo-blood group ABO system transferase